MIIELLDGTRFDIADYSLRRLYHYIPSASIEHNSVAVDGRSDIILNSKINNRVIRVDFVYLSQDIYDFYLIREEINALFLRNESYYITFKNEPHKRWLVRCANGYDLQPNMRIEQFSIEFITMNTYAESVADTEGLKEWDVDSWAWNGAINWDDDYNYYFNSNSFVVKNLGNVTIDPRQNQLDIYMRVTANDFLQITNQTTGDIYRYNRSLSNDDLFELRGIRTIRNGVSDLVNSNKKLITLAPGDNRFLIEGGNLSAASFVFRFLYK